MIGYFWWVLAPYIGLVNLAFLSVPFMPMGQFRARDFPLSRKSRGIRGIADLKWNPSKFQKKKNVSHTWLLALFCPFSSVDCAVPLLLFIHMLIVHFSFRSPR